MQPTGIEAEVQLICSHCSIQVGHDDRYCGFCGNEIGSARDSSVNQKIELLKPSGLYYFMTALLLAVYKFTDAFPSGFEGNVVISVVDAVMVIGFSWYFRREITGLLWPVRVDLSTVVLIVAAALVGAVLVDAFAEVIERSAFGEGIYDTYESEDTAAPLLWAIIFTCVFPAVFEEVAFRGFILNGIANLTSREAAVYVSSFLFGIMHFSILSLFWLVPLGVAFAWLRIRYKTLWYGIIAHFFYNLFITLIAFDMIPGLR